jgi:hypothetical protein
MSDIEIKKPSTPSSFVFLLKQSGFLDCAKICLPKNPTCAKINKTIHDTKIKTN